MNLRMDAKGSFGHPKLSSGVVHQKLKLRALAARNQTLPVLDGPVFTSRCFTGGAIFSTEC
jgi:hypothetical protein